MIPIYFNELGIVLQSCTQLRPDECSPKDIRQLVVSQLSRTNANLAERLKQFDGAQMLALSAFVYQAQALVGMGANARETAADEDVDR